MNILIIGCKGFIGTNLATYFKRKAYYVVGCDVITDYNDLHYINVNATNSDFREVFSFHTYDVCINCSGAANVADSFVHNHRDYSLNTNNVFAILETIRLVQPTCKFINLSSAAVYGNPVELPVSENHAISPISPYGMHKKYAEEICGEFHSLFQLQTLSLRIFSAFGDGLKKQLFWDIYQKSRNSNRIELYGTGLESRDFIYVEDLCKAIEIVVLKGNFNGGAYNVANGIEITIKYASDLFLSILDWSGEVVFNNRNRDGFPLRWKADISELESLGFQESNSIEDGLTKYAKWLKTLQ